MIQFLYSPDTEWVGSQARIQISRGKSTVMWVVIHSLNKSLLYMYHVSGTVWSIKYRDVSKTDEIPSSGALTFKAQLVRSFSSYEMWALNLSRYGRKNS